MSEKRTQTKGKVKSEQAEMEVLEQILSQPQAEIESLEGLLAKLPEADQKEAMRILYGDLPESIVIPDDVQKVAQHKDFDVAAYKFTAAKEQRRKPRVVRIAVIQNQIIKPTDAPIEEQFQAIVDRVTDMIDVAGSMGVNVLCLQEAWTMPFAFCTREKQPWLEFAENVDGPSTQIFWHAWRKNTTW